MATRGIYKITNPVGSVYIGQSVSCEKRMTRYKNLQCKRQPKIHASLVKYGVENHKYEIICELPKDVCPAVVNSYEELYISQYRSCGINTMNLTGGGHKNQELDESTREKLRKAATGKQHWLGRKHTQETKDKIRAANTGVTFTEERLRKMSEGNKGKIPTDAMRKKWSEARKGVKLDPYVSAKISKTRREKSKAGMYSSWTKLNFEIAEEIRYIYNIQKVTIRSLAKIYGVCDANIQKVLKNQIWIK